MSTEPLVSPELLKILRCPADHSPLHLADAEVIARLNQRLEQGELLNEGGAPVAGPLEGGLVREDGRLLYPIVDRLPRMLADEAIRLDEGGGPAADPQPATDSSETA